MRFDRARAVGPRRECEGGAGDAREFRVFEGEGDRRGPSCKPKIDEGLERGGAPLAFCGGRGGECEDDSGLADSRRIAFALEGGFGGEDDARHFGLSRFGITARADAMARKRELRFDRSEQQCRGGGSLCGSCSCDEPMRLG